MSNARVERMVQMNPYYAHHSPVGPVFDVATWSPSKAYYMLVIGFLAFLFFSAATCCVYKPELLVKADVGILDDLNREILKLWKNYPLGGSAAVGVLGFLSYLMFAGTVASAFDGSNPNYYFRAGAGGMSLRVPDGLDMSKLGFRFKSLELNLAWSDIESWKVVQKKQFGSLSPNTGNISVDLKLKTVDGKRYHTGLDGFEEAGRIIWKRIGEASEMTLMPFDDEPSSDGVPVAIESGEKQLAVESVLTKALWSGPSSVVVSDTVSNKFVQFVIENGSILLDLPTQALGEVETLRADDFFTALDEPLQESELLDRPGGAVVGVQRSFQLEFGDDAEQAATAAIEIFKTVYRLPDDFSIQIEEI